MDTFLQNYWSLYYEFLKDFERLNYKGFSLPYLCHLPSFLINREPLWSEMRASEFSERLNKQVASQKEFQQEFTTYVQSHSTKPNKNTKGKIVIHVDKLLRFSPEALANYINPSRLAKILPGRSNAARIEETLANDGSKEKKTVSANSKIRAKATSLKNTIRIRAKDVKRKQPAVNNNEVSKIPIYFFGHYLTDNEKAIKRLHNQAKEIFEAHSNHYLYKDKDFQKWVLNNISAVVKQLEMTINFLNDVSVSCMIVSTTHSYKNRILAVVGAKKGIPTICMQHGIISSELGYIPKIATVDAVYGNFEKDWYQKLGAHENSIEVVGHPRFDQVYRPPKLTKDAFYKSLGLDPDKKTLMIAVRGGYDNDRWRQLIKSLSSNLSINILIKNYPSKKPHTLTNEFPSVHPTGAYSIYDIFPHVDAVVAYSSTVGLEAMLANKTVFILKENMIGYTGYYSKLGSLVQTKPQELAKLIIEFFTNPKWKASADMQRKIFLGYAYPNSEKSFERLKSLINRLAS